MKSLGIDFGKKRVGVAVSDPLGRLALPVGVFAGKDRYQLLESLAGIVVEKEVKRVIVGHPLTMAGESGAQAKQTEEFAERLRYRLGEAVEVRLWDERLTSLEVDRVRPNGGKIIAGTRDMMAAVLILQSFLEFEQQRKSLT